MPDYKGKNDTKSLKFLVQERVKYRLNAFVAELGELPKNVLDFNFAERQYYGRINTNYNPVYANQSSLVPFHNEGDYQQVFIMQNFVKEAFSMLANKMKQAVAIGNISTEEVYLGNFKAYKAYQDPIELYQNYMRNRLEEFNLKHKSHKIENYEQWVMKFLEEAKIFGPNFPVTLSAFHRSRRSNIFTSGLAISVSDLDCGDDEVKQDFFLSTRAFQFYANAALQYGFSISKNSPWILIADLNSPAMTVYSKKFNLSNIKAIFNNNFYQCYEDDVSILQNILEFGYTEYKKMKPYNRTFKLNKNKTISNIKYLNNINNIKYNNIFYNNLYIEFRNIEEYNLLTDADIVRAKQKADFFVKELDNSVATDYINTQFKDSYFNRPGGVNSIIEKQKKASEE